MKPTLILLFAVGLALAGVGAVQAYDASSTNYKLQNGEINSFGGSASSTNYQLVDSGGQAFIGPLTSTNFTADNGYVDALTQSISLTLDSLTKTIPQVSPGTSQTATSTVTVYTDAAGYLLAAMQDHDLTHTNGSTTIPANSNSIASPGLWTEGTTVGLGFSLTSGTSLDAKWGSNPNYKYAAFPTGVSTTIHDKPLYSNSNDATTVQYRLDVSGTQLPGSYSNNVTYTATIKP